MTQKTIVANWKMNGSMQLAEELARALKTWSAEDPYVDAVICPPFPYIAAAKTALYDARAFVGGQDCHLAQSGAYTGDVSADMLVEMGASHVILGHSERRDHYNETSEQVRKKALAALNAGLIPIVCIGESLAQRQSGDAVSVVLEQMHASLPKQQEMPAGSHLLLAYEPIWAIGSGRTPELAEIAEMHQAMSAALSGAYSHMPPLLYGGSVKPANAAEILACEAVDGALVGGASLDVHGFIEILKAAEA